MKNSFGCAYFKFYRFGLVINEGGRGVGIDVIWKGSIRVWLCCRKLHGDVNFHFRGPSRGRVYVRRHN